MKKSERGGIQKEVQTSHEIKTSSLAAGCICMSSYDQNPTENVPQSAQTASSNHIQTSYGSETKNFQKH